MIQSNNTVYTVFFFIYNTSIMILALPCNRGLMVLLLVYFFLIMSLLDLCDLYHNQLGQIKYRMNKRGTRIVSNDYCDYVQPVHLITEVIVINLCYILTFLELQLVYKSVFYIITMPIQTDIIVFHCFTVDLYCFLQIYTQLVTNY